MRFHAYITHSIMKRKTYKKKGGNEMLGILVVLFMIVVTAVLSVVGYCTERIVDRLIKIFK